MPLGLGFNLQLDQPYNQPSFVATDISNCVWWLPPAMTSMFTDHLGFSEVTADGQVVGRWADASGVGNNATQSTAADKPIYKTGIQNGLPMVLFDGTTDNLRANSLAATIAGNDTAFTFVCVFKKVTNSGADTMIGAGVPGSATASYIYVITTGATYELRKSDDTATTVGRSAGTANTNAHCLLCRFNGTTVDAWVDNTQIINNLGLDVGVTTPTQFALGMLPRNTNTSFFDGYIGEVALWNRALTNTECGTVRTALIGKWAL